jgi:carbon-monoxide dehydrogenase medium subunit
MTMYNFVYHRPASIEEAAAIIAEVDDGCFLAGGQTLLPAMKLRLSAPSDLVDLAAIDALKGIEVKDGALVVGAMTTHAEVASQGHEIPALAALASGIGDRQVRNRGTIGGSIANNDPAADYPAALVGLGASIETNRRRIAAESFFKGLFETALGDDEIVTAVHFPKPESAAYAKFYSPASRFAIVGLMVARWATEVRVAVIGAGPCVFRVPVMEEALSSKFSPDAIEALNIPAEGLNDDLQASSEYRAHLVGVIARRAVAAAA